MTKRVNLYTIRVTVYVKDKKRDFNVLVAARNLGEAFKKVKNWCRDAQFGRLYLKKWELSGNYETIGKVIV